MSGSGHRRKRGDGTGRGTRGVGRGGSERPGTVSAGRCRWEPGGAAGWSHRAPRDGETRGGRGPDSRSLPAVPDGAGRARDVSAALRLLPLPLQPGRAAGQLRVRAAGSAPVSPPPPSRGSGGLWGCSLVPPRSQPSPILLVTFTLDLCQQHGVSPSPGTADGAATPMGASTAHEQYLPSPFSPRLCPILLTVSSGSPGFWGLKIPNSLSLFAASSAHSPCRGIQHAGAAAALETRPLWGQAAFSLGVPALQGLLWALHGIESMGWAWLAGGIVFSQTRSELAGQRGQHPGKNHSLCLRGHLPTAAGACVPI